MSRRHRLARSRAFRLQRTAETGLANFHYGSISRYSERRSRLVRDRRPAYCADCARFSIRLLISLNSDTSALVFLPATVAASISVPNNRTVARSALHGKQNLSLLPGSSKSSVKQPHTLHWPTDACSVISMLNAFLLRCLVPIFQGDKHLPWDPRSQNHS
jgi:hypothetical protein